MLNPPISGIGGKSKLRKTIINMIPHHICHWVHFLYKILYVAM